MSETPPEETPGLPDGGPATLGGVKLQAGVKDNLDDDRFTVIVNAVNDRIRAWPVAAKALGQVEWPAGVILGANMLAARLWRRKDTPAGVEIFGDGGFAYVRRTDPDIAMLLELGEWSKPAVG